MPLPTPFTFSQASLQDYADCPRRFQLRYIERLSYPAIESEPTLENERHQQEGEAFHRLTQQYLLGIPAEKVGKLASSPNLERWWDNFLANFSFNRQTDTLYPEMNLSAPLAGARLMAKYDLILVSDTPIVTIYDWKTYRKRPKNEFLVARLQTRVYRALLARAGAHLNGGRPISPENIEMVYWFADFPNDPARFRYDAAQYQRDWDFLEKTAKELASQADFPPTDETRHCAYCTYRSYCDRGIRAGDGDTIESELTLDISLEQVQEIEL
jgi:predicted RecB family nuclease